MTYQPFVSLVVPTRDRPEFLPMMFHYINYQTYPAKKMEIVIYDDGKQSIKDVLPNDKRIRYFRSQYDEIKKHRPIGNMRNFLNKQARGEVIVSFDDDDYYFPERVEHAVQMLQESHADIVGCSNIPIYLAAEGFFINGYRGPNHSCASAMAYNQRYLKAHEFDKTKVIAEEASFTADFGVPMFQLDPKKTQVAINHGSNTFDKRKMIGPATMIYKPALEVVFKDPKALAFYKAMRKDG